MCVLNVSHVTNKAQPYRVIFFIMPELVFSEEEARRVRTLHERVKVLGLKKVWIAEQIGRTRQNVTEVLNASLWSPGTLALIEELVVRLETEEVVEAP